MRILFISQLAVAVLAALSMAVLGSGPKVVAIVYGALLGLMVTLLTWRNTDRVLQTAVTSSARGMAAMFFGFVLRYAAAVLGIMIGFKVLELSAEPMIVGFILMVVVQALVAGLVKPPGDKREA